MASSLPPRVPAFPDFVQNGDLAVGQEFHTWSGGSITNELDQYKKSDSTNYHYANSSEESITYHQHVDCWSDLHDYSHPPSHKNHQHYPAIYPVDGGSSYAPSGLLNRADETSHYPRRSWGRNSTDENILNQQDTGCYYYFPEDENKSQNYSSYYAGFFATKYASSNPEPIDAIPSRHQERPAAKVSQPITRKMLDYTMGLNTPVTSSNRPAKNHEYSTNMQPTRTYPTPAAAVIPGNFKKIIDNTPAAGNESASSLRSLDIVCGRGAPTNFHYGNQVFRDLVGEYQTKYLCAKRSDKPTIAMEVLETIKARGGRFVRRQKAGGGVRLAWEPIHDKSAYEKVCQWLREGAPNLQRRVLSSISVRSAQRQAPFPDDDAFNKDSALNHTS